MGLVISLDGKQVIKVSGKGNDPRQLGNELAQQAISQGASEILAVGHGQMNTKVLITRPRAQADPFWTD